MCAMSRGSARRGRGSARRGRESARREVMRCGSAPCEVMRCGSARREVVPRSWSEEGNTLVLMPVAVVVLLGLAALALDATTLYLGQRRLADLAAAVATDTAGVLDRERFYTTPGDPVLDFAAGQERADALTASLGQDRTFEEVHCAVRGEGLTVTVSCEGTVRPILAAFWPGLDGQVRQVVVEQATALES